MIIAISGKIGSGKSTVACMLKYILQERRRGVEMCDILYEDYTTVLLKKSAGVKIRSFASPLKKIVSILTGCDTNKLYDSEFKTRESNYYVNGKKLTYRECLTHIGDLLRQDDRYVFCNCALHGIRENEIIVIDDLRFRDEYNYLKSLYRTLFIRLNTVKYSTNHISETDLDSSEFAWDYVICHRLTPKQLFQQCKNIVNIFSQKLLEP